MLYSNTIKIIICGDININYLSDSTYKQSLDLILASYDLSSTVKFPTRIQENSFSTTDNIFINTFKFNNVLVYPITNGLSDHDAQGLIICNIFALKNNTGYYYTWKINELTIMDFNIKLSYELWEDVFAEKNVDIAFNNFLNIYLRIFYSSFPLKKVYFKSENKAWLTPGLKISCANKRLFLAQRSSNDPILINYYKRYCKMLSCVIKSAKQ
jgi:hypothetical protein